MNSNIFKVIELITLYVGFPLLYYFDLIPGHKSIPLLLAFGYCLLWLLRNKDFSRRKLGVKNYNGWKFLFIRVIATAMVIYVLTYLFFQDSLFYIVRERFWLWLIIMIFYPIWSAYPQELIYRTYFFERYISLFSNKKILVVVNGLLFGFLHIIFGNWIAVAGASVVGSVWAYTYSKNQSLLAVAIEHAIVGNLIFTIGLGQFFYVPDF